MHPPPTILITTLAAYQTRFWLPVARWLLDAGRSVRLLAFDDRSAEMAAAAALPFVNMYRCGLAGARNIDDQDAFAARLSAYAIDHPNLLFSHERVTFGVRDSAQLSRRFMIYANAMERVLDELAREGQGGVLIQELGGFISVIASYFAARHRLVDNFFIEPSYFRGRIFLIKNSFAALPAMAHPAGAVSPEVAAYLEDTLARQAIVVPSKDQHQYVDALTKVLNARNVRRLVEKLYDQRVLRKHQEFGHNIGHAWRHVNMARNAMLMRRYYRRAERRFVYFPLHVPADMALTLRSPEYLDQIALVDYLLRSIPQGYDLVIKEHPAQIGAIPARNFKQLLRRYDTLIVLPPQTNNYDVLGNADAVVSVNSKSGAEALMLGKPVLVLGDAFYSTCPLVMRVPTLSQLPGLLKQALASPGIDRATRALYFQAAWNLSRPGELYASEPAQIRAMGEMIANLDATPAVTAPMTVAADRPTADKKR